MSNLGAYVNQIISNTIVGVYYIAKFLISKPIDIDSGYNERNKK